jgi:transcriptional regulator with XRE-family HTH domain
MDRTTATNALLEALKFTAAETAAKLGVSEATLANWRSQRKGPIAVRIGRTVYYYADDLETYLQEERNKAYADKKTRTPVALPVQHRRARVRRFDGNTGHRR